MPPEQSPRMLRLSSIIGRNGILPISRATFYQGIKTGRFPKPYKIGRISVWSEFEMALVIKEIENGRG